MSEGNQYLLAHLDRLPELLYEDGLYGPAIRILVQEQVPEYARPYVQEVIARGYLTWDRPPLSSESWDTYAAISGFYAQALRLFGKDTGVDVWSGWMRSAFISADWQPLPWDFGWKVACRPLLGIAFDQFPPSRAQSLSYLTSWPHGYLRLEECQRYEPALVDVLAQLAEPLGLEAAGWSAPTLAKRLQERTALTREERFELFNATSHPATEALGELAWQLQRGLVLLDAMRQAVDTKRDLFSVGY